MKTTKLKRTREGMWMENFNALKCYIEENGQLPGKKSTDSLALLNWWKYNKKCIKAGKLSAERIALLSKLNNMRLVKRDDASEIFKAPK
jgi:hypothetical protein